MISFKVSLNDEGQRVERIISARFNVSYNFLQKLFRQKKIKLNRERAHKTTLVKAGDWVNIYSNLNEREDDSNGISEAEKAYRNNFFRSLIIFENKLCIVINKPSGLPVQPGSKVNLCVQDLIKAYDNNLKLVHRLDKDTSGVLIIAKGLSASQQIATTFKSSSAHKKYLAVVSGMPAQKSGIIKAYLKKTVISNEEKVVTVLPDDPEGVYSETRYNLIRCGENKSLLELYPITGRTHQLRVHCAEILKAPIFGDKKYGTDRKTKNMYLHACNIKIDALKIDVTAEIPEYFRAEIAKMQDVNNQAHLVFLSGVVR